MVLITDLLVLEDSVVDPQTLALAAWSRSVGRVLSAAQSIGSSEAIVDAALRRGGSCPGGST